MFPSFHAQLHSCLWVRKISDQRFSGKVSHLSQWPRNVPVPCRFSFPGVNCRHGWGFSDEWIPTASRFVLNISSSTNTWVSLIHFEYIYICIYIYQKHSIFGVIKFDSIWPPTLFAYRSHMLTCRVNPMCLLLWCGKRNTIKIKHLIIAIISHCYYTSHRSTSIMQ